MAMRFILSAAGLALLSAQPAMAADVADSTNVIRLSPEQKAEAMAGGSEKAVDAALAQAAGGGGDDGIDYADGRGDRRIHGEVGFMIGTGGARGVYGTAAIPLGDNAGAVVSFFNERYALPRAYRRR